ncbi:MAG: SRPBCC domain-containing protein [Bacteroidota bacterium]
MPGAKKDTSDRELIITRLLNAPVSLVWEVWTNPEHIKKLVGANRFHQYYFFNGRKTRWRMGSVMHGPDGTDYKNKVYSKK